MGIRWLYCLNVYVAVRRQKAWWCWPNVYTAVRRQKAIRLATCHNLPLSNFFIIISLLYNKHEWALERKSQTECWLKGLRRRVGKLLNIFKRLNHCRPARIFDILEAIFSFVRFKSHCQKNNIIQTSPEIPCHLSRGGSTFGTSLNDVWPSVQWMYAMGHSNMKYQYRPVVYPA